MVNDSSFVIVNSIINDNKKFVKILKILFNFVCGIPPIINSWENSTFVVNNLRIPDSYDPCPITLEGKICMINL